MKAFLNLTKNEDILVQFILLSTSKDEMLQRALDIENSSVIELHRRTTHSTIGKVIYLVF